MVTQREKIIATSWKNIMGRASDFESLNISMFVNLLNMYVFHALYMRQSIRE